MRLCATRRRVPPTTSLVPVKRKDLFRLLGLNDPPPTLLDPTDEADAKKVSSDSHRYWFRITCNVFGRVGVVF